MGHGNSTVFSGYGHSFTVQTILCNLLCVKKCNFWNQHFGDRDGIVGMDWADWTRLKQPISYTYPINHPKPCHAPWDCTSTRSAFQTSSFNRHGRWITIVCPKKQWWIAELSHINHASPVSPCWQPEVYSILHGGVFQLCFLVSNSYWLLEPCHTMPIKLSWGPPSL